MPPAPSLRLSLSLSLSSSLLQQRNDPASHVSRVACEDDVRRCEAVGNLAATPNFPLICLPCRTHFFQTRLSSVAGTIYSYGDPINPDADLVAMASLRDNVASDGTVIVAVPIGKDAIFWNEGRVYGRRRLPLLLQAYTIAASFGVDVEDLMEDKISWSNTEQERMDFQPVFVLEARH